MSFISVNHTQVDTVIFDFDGTLAELNIDFDQMRRGIYELVSCCGVDPQTLQHRFVLEVIAEAGAVLEKSSRRQSQSFQKEAFRIIEAIEVEAAQRGKLFDGTKELLTTLRKHSVHAGIITRNCAKAVHRVFPDIADYCPVVVCRDDVKQVKPHPEQINLALSRLGGSANRAMMIGDHPIDIETGKNAGTQSAGVLSGHFQEEDFMLVGADMVLPQASDILRWLSAPQKL
jgi:phosphoglycolate phosphatase